jgi:membrane protease YdiL (CAAX protease family)
MLVFFVVGFGVPWIGWTAQAILGLEGAGAYALIYTGDFLSIAGLVATFVAAGALGLRSLLRRCVRIRAPLGWALFAFFLPLTWTLVPGLIYAATHGGIGRIELGGLSTWIGPSLLAVTTGPLGEEIGWRGYLQPRMLGRYSPLAASLLIGVIWSIWHLPLYYGSAFASLSAALLFTAWIVLSSALLTVLWGFTGASVFWAITFHWMSNTAGSAMRAVFPDLDLPADEFELWSLATMAVVTVVVYVLVGRERLARKLDEAMALLADELPPTASGTADPTPCLRSG